jgi:transposase
MREKLFTLSKTQRNEMEHRYKRTNDRRVTDRIQAILLLDAGKNLHDVAATLYVSKKIIKRWISVFTTYGLDELCTLKYENSGAPSALSTAQQDALEEHLASGVYSTKEVLSWVKEQYGIDYSESGMAKLLRRLGYSFKKPAQVPSKANMEAQAAWLKDYEKKESL